MNSDRQGPAGARGETGTDVPPPRGSAKTYVLVHGAWCGGWVWKPVAAGLRALGHTVHAPSLTGLGDRRHLLRPGINLDTHVDDIVNLIRMEDLHDVVLVGWSYGGMVVTDVLARVTDRIASMIYLDAFVPARGRSLVSYRSVATSIDVAIQAAAEGRDITPISPTEVMTVRDPAVLEFMAARLGEQPVLSFLQASKALPERPRIPHLYVLAGDGAESRSFRQFLAECERDPVFRTLTMDAGHVMMLTDVEATIRLLADG